MKKLSRQISRLVKSIETDPIDGIAVKALADTARQLVSVYAKQRMQITRLAKRVEELEKAKE